MADFKRTAAHATLDTMTEELTPDVIAHGLACRLAGFYNRTRHDSTREHLDTEMLGFVSRYSHFINAEEHIRTYEDLKKPVQRP